MSKGLKSVKTLTAREIAKKWNLPLSVVVKKIVAGVKVEKEHTTNVRQANEIARDHLGERPDYYDKLRKIEKTKIVKENTTVTGVAGLGFVTGTPAVDSDNEYVSTNALARDTQNGAKLEYIKKIHSHLHNKLGFKQFNPMDIKNNSNNTLDESLGSDYGTAASPIIGDLTGSSRKVMKVDEVKIPPKIKKAAATGMTLANLATLGQVAGDAAEGRKGSDPKRGLVAATSTLPGPVGWGATGLNYTIKGYDKAREHLRAKVKQMKEEQIDEISAELVGKVSNARFRQGKAPSKTLSHAINKKFIESGKKKEDKKEIKEVAMAMPPAVQPPAVVGQQVPGVKRQAPRPTQVSGSAAGRMAGQSGSMSARPNVKVSSGVQPSIERSWSRSGSARMGSGGGSMSASSTKVGTSFSQGGVNVGQKMAAAKQTSPVVKGMTTAGRDAAALVSKAAPAASRIAGTALRVAGGPAATAAAAVMSPTPAGAGEDEKKRQDTLKSYNPYKAQGRSIDDYEKQILSPSKEKTNTTPAQGSTKNVEPVKGASINPDRSPKVDAPTPPSRPEYFSRGQAFQAARSETGGAGGKFSYGGSEYQTNVKGEPYAAKPKQTSVTDIKEETKMENHNLINEAIENILENDLNSMKENFTAILQEKALERLEEKKKEIAANYFGQE